ncbi:MAG: glucosaminidase domain-containing protein [Atopobiaceae bacterium]|nr:glucosaminidase domain-containing protein [Atopobiaceae bacterium]
MSSAGFAKRNVAIACSAALALTGLMGPVAANAQESSEVTNLRKQAEEMSGKIEEATTTYQSAAAVVSDLEGQIAENEARTAEIEEKLPGQRERTAVSIKNLYLLQQSSAGLIDLILSSSSFNDFITTLQYIDTIQQRNNDEVEQLASMDNELKQTQEELSKEYEVAEQKRNEALSALEEARAAKRALQQRADAIAQAEAKAREEAIAAAQAAKEAKQKAAQEAAEREKANKAAEEEKERQKQEPEQKQEQEEQKQEEQKQEEPQESTEATFTTSSGYTAPIEVPTETTSVSTEPMTSNTTSEETSGWAARIDAYLAGSPLAGHGSTFAKAAAQYGVDPRFSPAISCVESGKGSICFLPHNAWGWGSSSWPDWDTAIYDHVAGLASGYDGTLTLEGAMRYCPPTYQEWYSSVLAEMNSI